MTDVRTRIPVGPDHRISGTAPANVPEGEHEATIMLTERPRVSDRAGVTGLPVHDWAWDGSVSLRRGDLYGTDGR